MDKYLKDLITNLMSTVKKLERENKVLRNSMVLNNRINSMNKNNDIDSKKTLEKIANDTSKLYEKNSKELMKNSIAFSENFKRNIVKLLDNLTKVKDHPIKILDLISKFIIENKKIYDVNYNDPDQLTEEFRQRLLNKIIIIDNK